jgi:hypothetical protein
MATDPIDTSDLRLPDELQFVAEQLVEDADFLERTFPANAPRNWRRAFAVAVAQKALPTRQAPRPAPKEDRTSGRAFGSVAAAAVVVVLAGWYATTGRDTLPSGNPGASAHSRSNAPANRIIPAGVFSGLDGLLQAEPPQRPRFELPMGADYFNRMFSGPEQEAVLDVFREHQIPEPSLRY